jgi:hypothetical protein
METCECVKVLTNDFSILSTPEKQRVLEESKQRSRELLAELRKARELDPQQLREPCSL